MTTNPFFLDAIARFRPDMHIVAGVRDWEDVLTVSKLVLLGTADPINNIYPEFFLTGAYTHLPRPRRTRFGDEQEDLSKYAHGVHYGAEMLFQLNLPADFKPKEQPARVAEAHGIGQTLKLFVSAGLQLTEDKRRDPMKYAQFWGNEMSRAYVANAPVLKKLGAAFDDAVVAFVNKEHLTHSDKKEPLPIEYRGTIDALVAIGRRAIRNGNGKPKP